MVNISRCGDDLRWVGNKANADHGLPLTEKITSGYIRTCGECLVASAGVESMLYCAFLVYTSLYCLSVCSHWTSHSLCHPLQPSYVPVFTVDIKKTEVGKIPHNPSSGSIAYVLLLCGCGCMRSITQPECSTCPHPTPPYCSTYPTPHTSMLQCYFYTCTHTGFYSEI